MHPLRILLILAGLTASSRAFEPLWHSQPVALAAGSLANTGSQPQTTLLGYLSAPNATLLRVGLKGFVLDSGVSIRITALSDGQTQTLNAGQIESWGQRSAIFNGTAVKLELLLPPGAAQSGVVISQLWWQGPEASTDDCCPRRATRTLCGPDNRVPSADNRVGRINGGCTGWLVSNGAVLTAGHCGIAAGSILEVNVPASSANGNRVAASVQDQFPVLAGSITTVNAGVGNDWTVCRVGPNNLGQSAHRLHGFFRMTRELPAESAILRVTGCGIDNSPVGSQPSVCGNRDSAGNCTHFGLNAQSQTLQTSTGTFAAEATAGTGIRLTYQVDTEPANSGSPIIWEQTGFAVGIHTAGGCSSGGGANNGTSFELDALENAIAGVPGANTRYLDTINVPGGAEDGTVFQPFNSLVEAVPSVPNTGVLCMVPGNYTGSANRTIITRPMTLTAPVGTVVLGE